MNLTKNDRRKARSRAKVFGTATRPRLSVKITNKHIIAQIINDESSATLAYAATVKKTTDKGTMTEKAALIGKEIAKKALAVKVTKVVFDRNGKLFAGRLSALAEAARKEGLEF
ncbi:MAG: 50S ribosomal protein L18 [Candidatus Nomurabacteria bacterium]|jgi:large subunit ribosomal protein L18|nr:50S ribosomal protein L18 [Candidatus Nomurabacteria bacterium]